MQELFLTCPGGLESICEEELNNLGITKTRIKPGGISFYGDQNTILKVNLWSRTGVRLLTKIRHFECRNSSMLYNGIYQINWGRIFSIDNTFSIHSFIRSTDSTLKNTHYATQICKDAIVDRFKEMTARRPQVDKSNPQFQIFLHVHHNRATVYLNSSGQPLYKRGYRKGKIHKASLNESLAAGIILLTGWDRISPIYDPMCGSGTFAIEATMIAENFAPGLLRQNFAFMNWNNYDPFKWKRLCQQAKDRISKNAAAEIFASDVRKDAIQLAKTNAGNISDYGIRIRWSVNSITEVRPNNRSGIIVMNPPYGERTGDLDELKILYGEIGDTLKNHWQGFQAYIFTMNSELIKKIGLKTSRKIHLRNGNLDCRLLKYELYSGSKKRKYITKPL